MKMRVVGVRAHDIDTTAFGHERTTVLGRTEVEITNGSARVTFLDWRAGPVTVGDEFEVTVERLNQVNT